MCTPFFDLKSALALDHRQDQQRIESVLMAQVQNRSIDWLGLVAAKAWEPFGDHPSDEILGAVAGGVGKEPVQGHENQHEDEKNPVDKSFECDRSPPCLLFYE